MDNPLDFLMHSINIECDKNPEFANLIRQKRLLMEVELCAYALFSNSPIHINRLQNALKDTEEAKLSLFASMIEPQYYNDDAMTTYRKYREKILNLEIDFLSEILKQ